MAFRFPLADVVISITAEKRTVEKPGYTNRYVSLNQQEFTLDIEKVAWFYACGGNHVEVIPNPEATLSTLQLYLNGSVYGAILHQRKTMPLHGSCFQYQGLGIMICGESGVGKSSLTTSFCLNGANFLTDDVTPVLFKRGKPHIWGVSDRIKLWSDSLRQLDQQIEGLDQIVPEQGKFYFPMESDKESVFPLDHIFVLHVHDEANVRVEPLEGTEKFAVLRNEIYRREYLKGMAESETVYFEQLIAMSQAVTITKVTRPAQIPIEQLRIKLEKIIFSIELNQKFVAEENNTDIINEKVKKI